MSSPRASSGGLSVASLEEPAPPVPSTPKSRVGRAVWHYLRGVFPRTFQPKQIAAAVREKQGTVRKELVRLEASGHVVRMAPGWYRAWASPDLLALAERPEPSVHGLQITVPVPLDGGLPVPRGAKQARLEPDGRWGVNDSDQSATHQAWVLGRSVLVQAFQTGTALVNISATRDPVKFGEWSDFAGRLRGMMQAFGIDLDGPQAFVVNVEFNVDWRAFFLGDLKRMKLRALERGWAQLYQKHRDALRMELRVSPRELTFKEASEKIVFLAEAPWLAAAPKPRPIDPNDPAVV